MVKKKVPRENKIIKQGYQPQGRLDTKNPPKGGSGVNIPSK